MAALVQLSVHILCLLWLDNASASGKLAVTFMQLHSLQRQSNTVQDMESMTLPDSLLGRSQCCPQQCTAKCTNMPLNIYPSAQALTLYFIQSNLSLEHV